MIQSEFIKSADNWKDCPIADKPEYAFIGRSNVGKSSLINMLAEKKDLAKTSSTPGKTQLINTFLIDKSWYLADLPGYGYARVSKSKRSAFKKMIYDYLMKRSNLVTIFVLIDSRHSPQKIDLEFMESLTENQLSFSMIFTKTDKLNLAILQKNLQLYKEEMLKTWEELPEIFISSSIKKTGKNEILEYINSLNEQLKNQFQ